MSIHIEITVPRIDKRPVTEKWTHGDWERTFDRLLSRRFTTSSDLYDFLSTLKLAGFFITDEMYDVATASKDEYVQVEIEMNHWDDTELTCATMSIEGQEGREDKELRHHQRGAVYSWHTYYQSGAEDVEFLDVRPINLSLWLADMDPEVKDSIRYACVRLGNVNGGDSIIVEEVRHLGSTWIHSIYPVA